MEEIKIGGKAEVGYMGGSKWTGVNSTGGYMRYSDINKIVKKAFKTVITLLMVITVFSNDFSGVSDYVRYSSGISTLAFRSSFRTCSRIVGSG